MRRLLMGCVSVFAGGAAAAATPPAWLAGHWQVKDGARTTDEVWLAPADGLMVGMSRTVGGKKPFFEFARIETRGDALYYVAQPGGAPPTEFKSVTVDADSIVFENASHDFPQRVIYRRNGDDRVDARIEGQVKGRLEGQDWRYERVR